ncbi:uncharacterized protein PRCAT00005532001 [Priceomyces carsonii]|uniref:uncharacterized protein n=1 Tax=Priceomyces carsonii TaxID=28549 RepID=UPI002ED82F4A|nr:unnamed protein product [Priceomyces carsonii]
MISANSIRISKAIFILIILINVTGLLFALIYLNSHKYVDKGRIWNGIQMFNDKYKPKAVANSLLEDIGYQIEPQNVQFKFINPKNKHGLPDMILQQNSNRYADLVSKEINEPKDFNIDSIRPPEDISGYDHANATIIALVRNTEASGIIKSIRRLEKAFNSKFQYPYTFLNDQPFTERFKDRMRKASSAPMNFVQIPPQLWDQPSNIDTKKEREAMRAMADHNIAYAQKKSYHNMCRFYLGNFYNVPELQDYRYYWRLEPSVDFYSDVNYDVFKYLEGTKKKYGFTISLYDIDESVATLWPETLKFLNTDDNFKLVNKNGAFQWLLEDQQNPKKNLVANGYSTCHFWSNFEIGDMDFFRSEPYDSWFRYLDSTGKFYYERWGDAPVHSVGLSLFADKNDIHWFRDIGYYHDPYLNCPNTPKASGCETGKFSIWKHLSDQNCMMSWVDYSINDPDAIY